jgi:hypothetical protein
MKNKRRQNPLAVAMQLRHGGTTTRMRDRRDRRPKDTRHTKLWVMDCS